jgi:hypothetical protein
VLEFLNKVIRQKKEIQWIQIEKEKVKFFLFPDGMILYLKDSKNSTKKHSKVAEYKVSTQKSVAFLYPNNE